MGPPVDGANTATPDAAGAELGGAAALRGGSERAHASPAPFCPKSFDALLGEQDEVTPLRSCAQQRGPYADFIAAEYERHAASDFMEVRLWEMGH